jgi:enoyl-CoA hydratase
MLDFKNIILDVVDQIATLTINRPKKLNALNFETLQELDTALDLIAEDRNIKGVIITGSGEKAFVAGADISEFTSIQNAEKVAKNGQRIFAKIENLNKPVIATIQGYALGGGCELALACHMRIAAENAIFSQPEVNLGLIPGYGGTQRLTHLVGKGKAIELITTADMIDAQEAYKIGLLNHVVPVEQLTEKALEILNKIKQKPPISVSLSIEAINASVSNPETGYHVEAECFAKSTKTKDFTEGTSAFLEKRKADFKGE